MKTLVTMGDTAGACLENWPIWQSVKNYGTLKFTIGVNGNLKICLSTYLKFTYVEHVQLLVNSILMSFSALWKKSDVMAFKKYSSHCSHLVSAEEDTLRGYSRENTDCYISWQTKEYFQTLAAIWRKTFQILCYFIWLHLVKAQAEHQGSGPLVCLCFSFLSLDTSFRNKQHCNPRTQLHVTTIRLCIQYDARPCSGKRVRLKVKRSYNTFASISFSHFNLRGYDHLVISAYQFMFV